MAKQAINIGTTANDGTGDTVRAAFDKTNDNTNELYNLLGDGSTLSITGDVSVSAGAVTIANDAVTTAKITDANITTAKIAADAIDSTKIADDAIDSEHYVDGSIDTIHFSSTTEIALVTDQNSGNLKLWSGTQAQYNALTPDSNTIYFIV